MSDDLERRLDAVERAITGRDRDVADLSDAAELDDRLESVETHAEDLERRLADLEAAVRALRGFVGRLRATGAPAAARDGDREQASDPADGDPGLGPDGHAEDPGATGDRHREDDGTDWEWNWAAHDADADGEGDDENGDHHASEGDESRPTAPRDGTRADAPREQTVEGGDEHAREVRGHESGYRETAVGRAETREGDPVRGTDCPPTTGRDTRDRDRRRDRPGGDADRGAGQVVAASEAPSPQERGGDPAASAGRSRPGAHPDSGDGDWRSEPDPVERWPGDGDVERGAVDDRRRGGDETWPEGMDVERAEPWAVPDPPTLAPEPEDDGGEDGLIDRVREAF